MSSYQLLKQVGGVYMQILCEPGLLQGNIHAIPSKSDAHRLLICAALSNQPTKIIMPGWQGEDIKTTIRCLSALGASFQPTEQGCIVNPITVPLKNPILDCKESGSTLRFLLPIVAALGCGGRFIGSGRLPERPISPLLEALKKGGVFIDSNTLPFQLEGKLLSKKYMIPGNVSSQFISGLLFALPLIEGGGTIHVKRPLESAGYVNMTLDTLNQFSIYIETSTNKFRVPPNQYYQSPKKVSVEGDWSNMAFFLTAGALALGLSINGAFFQLISSRNIFNRGNKYVP